MKILTSIWTILALLLLVANHVITRPHRTILPFPTDTDTVVVIRADTTLQFTHKNGQWMIDGKPSTKFATWLEELQTACTMKFPRKNVTLGDAVANITLLFNNKDEWIFASHNEFSRAHYLLHADTAYLCNEQFKPRLTLPLSYWL